MKKYLSVLLMALSIGMMSACGNEPDTTTPVTHPYVNELKIIDNVVGDGDKIINNHRVAVHYTGWIYDDAAADKKGKKFDSSYDRNRPFVFSIGSKNVIDGWEKGLIGMKVGGKRTLIIPPTMAYGTKGAGSSVPANAALIFDIELLQAG